MMGREHSFKQDTHGLLRLFRRLLVLMLDRDGTVLCVEKPKPKPNAMKRAYAELPHEPDQDQTSRIGRLVDLAFDQLGFRRLELHVSDDHASKRR